jgi:hypothetical protein
MNLSNNTQNRMDPLNERLPTDAGGSFWSFPRRVMQTMRIIYFRPREFTKKIVLCSSISNAAIFGIFSTMPIAILFELIPVGWHKLLWKAGSEHLFFTQKWIHEHYTGVIWASALFVLIYITVLMIVSILCYLFILIWKGGIHSSRISLKQNIRFVYFIMPIFLLITYLPTQSGLVNISRLFEFIIWLLIGVGFSWIHKIQLWKGIGAVFSPIIIYFLIFKLIH